MKTDLPFYPVGCHVLILLDEDASIHEGTLVSIGAGVPDVYFRCDEANNRVGLTLGQRVMIDLNHISREYEDEPSVRDVVNYEPSDDDDSQDQPLPKYALVHIDGIYGISNISPNKK